MAKAMIRQQRKTKAAHSRRCTTALLATFLAFFSCSSIDCPVEHTVRTVYAFYTADLQADTLKDTLFIVSHRTNGSDTTLLNGGIKLTAFQLPIGYANPEDTLFFRFRKNGQWVTDTLWLKKENIPHFESVDCSASFFHELTAVRATRHAIDSVTINDHSVTYDPNTEHIRLFLSHRH
jgi:hypothetical protein